MRIVGLALFGTVCASLCPLSSTQAVETEGVGEYRVYELVAERARTRSQGIQGWLYSADGEELPPRLDMQTVLTPFGEFRYSACSHLWSECGYIRVGDQPTDNVGDPAADGPTVFRIIAMPGSATPTYRGELDSSNVPVNDAAATIESPLGQFRRCVQFSGLAWSGWIPDAWLDDAGRALCAGNLPSPKLGLAAPGRDKVEAGALLQSKNSGGILATHKLDCPGGAEPEPGERPC